MVAELIDSTRQREDVDGPGKEAQHDAPAHQREVELRWNEVKLLIFFCIYGFR